MRQTYTYRIPEELRKEAFAGKRVIVQFGQRKMYTGLIHSLHTKVPEADTIKDIIAVLDEEDIIPSVQLGFWEWIAEYYLCSLGEIYKAALPSGPENGE